ncbi:hypothetical protein B0J14DRAFT_643332 [Halenospora varia]|nr:hypothetical protein B0J14DRAFT_643332 [Halenospora varia]
MSTLVLSASNYTMQAISSPRRKEVDNAHKKSTWVDIGVPSIQNLRLFRGVRLSYRCPGAQFYSLALMSSDNLTNIPGTHHTSSIPATSSTAISNITSTAASDVEHPKIAPQTSYKSPNQQDVAVGLLKNDSVELSIVCEVNGMHVTGLSASEWLMALVEKQHRPDWLGCDMALAVAYWG